MAQASVPSEVALLPVHPVYANAILRGEKRVEFRKRVFKRKVEWVAIYATAPVKRVVGVFRVGSIEEGAPSTIWERFRSVGGISRRAYRQYFSGAKAAVAIQIDEVREFPDPICLSQVKSVSCPPQSFVYLCPSSREILFRDAGN